MKFKLICEYEDGDVITHEFSKIFLYDVLERTQDFLKGCGFVFNGTLDIVSGEFVEPSEKVSTDQDIIIKDYRNSSDVDEDGRC